MRGFFCRTPFRFKRDWGIFFETFFILMGIWAEREVKARNLHRSIDFYSIVSSIGVCRRMIIKLFGK